MIKRYDYEPDGMHENSNGDYIFQGVFSDDPYNYHVQVCHLKAVYWLELPSSKLIDLQLITEI